jgi:hypothetical protein
MRGHSGRLEAIMIKLTTKEGVALLVAEAS